MEPVLIRPAVPDDYEQAERMMQQVHALHLSWRPGYLQTLCAGPAPPGIPGSRGRTAAAGGRNRRESRRYPFIPAPAYRIGKPGYPGGPVYRDPRHRRRVPRPRHRAAAFAGCRADCAGKGVRRGSSSRSTRKIRMPLPSIKSTDSPKNPSIWSCPGSLPADKNRRWNLISSACFHISASTAFPAAQLFFMSNTRWLRLPRNRRVRSRSLSTNRPSTR